MNNNLKRVDKKFGSFFIFCFTEKKGATRNAQHQTLPRDMFPAHMQSVSRTHRTMVKLRAGDHGKGHHETAGRRSPCSDILMIIEKKPKFINLVTLFHLK